ncbi:MAG: ABC transporter ATP-binding protein [Fervidicoccaceae archaeon]
MSEFLLEVDKLSISYLMGKNKFRALKNINMKVRRGEVVALVGESGSGKTTLIRSIMRVLPKSAIIEEGKILFEGIDILKLSEEEMLKIRGKKITMVFQDPVSHLNPVMTVREQIVESLMLHRRMTEKEAEEEALRLLSLMRLKDPKRVLSLYPHQLSGGMAQRVLIAMALSSNPSMLIADEPTSALDPTVQVRILSLLKEIHEKENLTVLIVTHDLSVVAYMADYVYVIYGGRIMESGNVFRLFKNPVHPYTRELLLSLSGKANGESARAIKEFSEDGCPFAPRCPLADEKCAAGFPPYIEIGDGLYACYNADKGGFVS